MHFLNTCCYDLFLPCIPRRFCLSYSFRVLHSIVDRAELLESGNATGQTILGENNGSVPMTQSAKVRWVQSMQQGMSGLIGSMKQKRKLGHKNNKVKIKLCLSTLLLDVSNKFAVFFTFRSGLCFRQRQYHRHQCRHQLLAWDGLRGQHSVHHRRRRTCSLHS